MKLAEVVKKLRRPILDQRKPSAEMLNDFVEMLELENQEWLKVPDNDFKNQQWAAYLTSKAKEYGWIRECVDQGKLSKSWNNWPRHNNTLTDEQVSAMFGAQSVHTVSGGGFEKKRHKH